MKGTGAVLLALASQLSVISLLTFGGGINTVVPEIQRQAVDVRHWMDARTFADLFAISQAAPGPNMLVVTLVGLKAAGMTGAVVATLATCAPTCLVTYFVSKVWDRIRNSPWRAIAQEGLAPAAVGLIGTSAFLIARAADHGAALVAITAATGLFSYFTRFNPLWVMGVAAALGAIGWVG